MEQPRIWDRGSLEDEVEDMTQHSDEEARYVRNDEGREADRTSLLQSHPVPLADHVSVRAAVDAEGEV